MRKQGAATERLVHFTSAASLLALRMQKPIEQLSFWELAQLVKARPARRSLQRASSLQVHGKPW